MRLMSCCVVLAGLSLACQGGSAPEAAPAAPAAPAPPVAQAAPEVAVAPVAQVPRSAPADPAAYGGRWLAIVASTKTPGGAEAALARVRASGVGATPVTLDSSLYKGLMPCFEIGVAGAFESSAEASALVSTLKAAGIDAYAKSAGAFVGSSEAMQAFCKGALAPPPEACGAARFVEVHAGRTFMHLAVDPQLKQRSLSGASPARALDADKQVWAAQLPATSVGPWKVGEQIAVRDASGGQASCALTGFVALTRGTPHFSYAELKSTKPGCGEADAFAELSCPAGAWMIAAPAEGATVSTFAAQQAPQAAVDAALAAAKASPAVAKALKEAQAQAIATGATLISRVQTASYRSGGDWLILVHHEHLTGEGWNACGGDDVRVVTEVVVRVGADGRAALASAVVDASASGLSVPVDLEGDGHLELWQRGVFGNQWVTDPSGGQACGLPWAFCDCPC